MDNSTILQACALRLEGMSWEDIAQRLHYDRIHLAREVHRAVTRDRSTRSGGKGVRGRGRR